MSSQEADELRQRMASLRTDLQRDITSVSQEVHHATHWQYYVKKFPFLCAGAAFIAGYALIPAKKPASIVATDQQIKDLADAGKLHVEAEANTPQVASLSQKAVWALGTVAARAGMAYLEKMIGQKTQADGEPSAPQE